MSLPQKITPDNLKQTIVQILFKSDISHELFLGTFNHLFSDVLAFKAALPTHLTETAGFIKPLEKGCFLDKEGKIKVDVAGNEIVFNAFNGCILWDNYFPLISATIKKLFSTGMISEINRIGIRYLHQLDTNGLIDPVNISLSLDIPYKNLKTKQIKTEFEENEFYIILTLINKIDQLKKEGKEDLNTSIIDIDIDVIQRPQNMKDSKATLEAIENGYEKQQTIFFSLLKPALFNNA